MVRYRQANQQDIEAAVACAKADHDGWRAVCPWPGPDFTTAATKGRAFGSPIGPAELDELETRGWELYRITDDPTESTDVAAEHPAKLRELVALSQRNDEPLACIVFGVDPSETASVLAELASTGRSSIRRFQTLSAGRISHLSGVWTGVRSSALARKLAISSRRT